MLPVKWRLRRPADFRRVKALGRTFFSSFFSLKLAKNDLEQSRFAVVISTKISKKATQRNRLKRQLREIIYLYRQKIKPGYDIILYPKTQTLGQEYAALEKELLYLCHKARLL